MSVNASDAAAQLPTAFISYASADAAWLAGPLEARLESIGRAPGAPRAIDVFRDVSDRPVTPDLARDLLDHLDRSDFLILLCSPGAARSGWVGEEIAHWLSTKGVERLVLALADGQIVWSRELGAFDSNLTTALPAQLMRAFTAVPKWANFVPFAGAARFAEFPGFIDAVADIACFIADRPKASLVGAHWQEQRLMASRRLAQSAGMFVDSVADWALLLAAEASRLDPSPETSRALADVLERTSALEATPPEPPATAIGSATDPDRTIIGHDDGTIAVWEPDGSLTWITEQRTAAVTALSGSGAAIAWGLADGTVAWVAGAAADPVRVEAPGPVEHIAVNPSMGVIAAGTCDDGTNWISVWDVSGRRRLTGQGDETVYVRCVRWPIGSHPVVMHRDSRVELDLVSGEGRETCRLPVTPRPPTMAFDASATLVACAQLDEGWVILESLADDNDSDIACFKGLRTSSDRVAVAGTAEEWRVACRYSGGSVLVWSGPGDDPPDIVATTSTPFDDLVIGPAGTFVALVGGRAMRWSQRRTTLCHAIEIALEVPSVVQGAVSVSFSPDGRFVAWLSNPLGRIDAERPTVSTWDLIEWRRGPSLVADGTGPVRFRSPLRLFVGDHDPDERLVWDLESGETQAAPAEADAQPTYEVDDGVVSADGTMMAVSTATGMLKLVDLELDVERWSTPCPRAATLVFSTDERLVASTYGGQILLFSAADGQIVARFVLEPSAHIATAFSPDNRHLAVAGVGGTLTLIDIDLESWRTRATVRAGRTLSAEERETLGVAHIPEW